MKCEESTGRIKSANSFNYSSYVNRHQVRCEGRVSGSGNHRSVGLVTVLTASVKKKMNLLIAVEKKTDWLPRT